MRQQYKYQKVENKLTTPLPNKKLGMISVAPEK